MDLRKIKRNSTAISAGVWRENVDGEGLRLLVRGATSPEFANTYAEKLRAIPRASRDENGAVLPSVQDRVYRETIAAVGLLDWGGLFDGETEIAYSKALATELLTNRDYSEFYEMVITEMSRVDKTKAEDEAAVTGN